MLVQKELIERVKDYFNLNIYETKVWLALLSKGVASAGEVATISGVPRSRTYDVLESLEKRGFAIIKLGKPVKYLGLKPETIIEKMKRNEMKEAQDRIERLSKIRETEEFHKLDELYKGGVEPVKREDVSASLRGKSNISHYLREILQNAKKEVIICTHVEDITRRISLFKETIQRLQSSGVKVILALNGDGEMIKRIEEKIGVKSKKSDIQAKFFIVDRKEILFYLSKNQDNEDIAIWLNSDFFTNAFVKMFEKAVKSSKKNSNTKKQKK
ncbi:MAG: TrmB family transcriptional regulator [Nanoarchaeota archaeon]